MNSSIVVPGAFRKTVREIVLRIPTGCDMDQYISRSDRTMRALLLTICDSPPEVFDVMGGGEYLACIDTVTLIFSNEMEDRQGPHNSSGMAVEMILRLVGPGNGASAWVENKLTERQKTTKRLEGRRATITSARRSMVGCHCVTSFTDFRRIVWHLRHICRK